MKKAILIKPGELWLKGNNRSDFVDRLVLNVQNITGVKKSDIEVRQGRIYLKPSVINHKLLADLKYVFGIAGYVEAYKGENSMEDIEKFSYEIAKQAIEKGAKTFKVDTTRALKKFPKNSMELNAGVGEKVLEKFEELKVDIHNPDLVISIEVRSEGLFVYSSYNEKAASGGLPVGTSGRGLLMLSGGIDSPVAGWYMMKRGMSVDAVYFHSPPYTGDKTKEKILDICKALSHWKAAPIRLFVPHFTNIQTETSKEVDNAFWTLLHRRFMTKISQKLAEGNSYQALITGESLGQVASQTVENMAAVSYGVDIPIMRPLLGFDKQETIERAKEIETYEISILPYEDCCTVFSSDRPKIKAQIDSVAELEQKFNAEEMVNEALAGMEEYVVSFGKIEKVE